MSSNSKHFLQKNIQIRDSIIKETRNLIISNNLSGLMNNQKWINVFEWIEINRVEFEIKTLLFSNISNTKINKIFELDEKSLLLDNSGNFIDFLEIEFIKLEKTPQTIEALNCFNIEFIEENNKLKIQGYR